MHGNLVAVATRATGMVCEISREDLLTVLKDYPADKELLNPQLGMKEPAQEMRAGGSPHFEMMPLPI